METTSTAVTAVPSSSSSNNPTLLGTKKVDWDLKRNVAGKLKVLEKRTQRAIIDLLRTWQKTHLCGGGSTSTR